jgi:DNA recombination protein RmuC
MEIILTVLIIIMLAGFGGVFYYLKKKPAEGSGNEHLFTLLNQNIQGMQERIDKTTATIGDRLDNAARVVQGVQKELGSVQEIGRSIKDFQQFLNSPKLRGNLGEQVLYDALAEHFSKAHYDTQFKFREGQVVDAVIRTNQGLISIDSKFPLEPFRRLAEMEGEEDRTPYLRECAKSVKKHIDDVAKKYILPHEGTVDFAVMYVPSESVYYQITAENDSLMEHARTKRVLLVSPNSFFHFLRVVMMGLERTKLQEEAQRIWELLKAVQQETQKFGTTMGVLNRHVTNAKNTMDSASSEYTKLASKVDQVKLLK